MKKPVGLMLVLALLLLLPVPVSAGSGARKGTVTLVANQVVSAIEIETAFHQATAGGTRPGVVILDGSKGSFVLTGADISVNVMFSNLTLRGSNHAVLVGCGIYIDGSPADNITIENLTLQSTCDGVSSNGQVHRKVIIRNNLIRAEGTGVGGNRTVDWTVSNNVILAKIDGINFSNSQNAVIRGNHLSSGAIGVFLDAAMNSQVVNNAINDGWQGVLLNNESSKNRVRQNTFLNVHQAAVALEPGVDKNVILGNWMVCAFDANCVTVNAAPELYLTNTIKNNRP